MAGGRARPPSTDRDARARTWRPSRARPPLDGDAADPPEPAAPDAGRSGGGLPGGRPAAGCRRDGAPPRRRVRSPAVRAGDGRRRLPGAPGDRPGMGRRASWMSRPSTPRARRSGGGCRASSMPPAAPMIAVRRARRHAARRASRTRRVRLRGRLSAGRPGGRLPRDGRAARELAADGARDGASRRSSSGPSPARMRRRSTAVVDAIRTLDRPPICFTGGPASLDVDGRVGGGPAAVNPSTRPSSSSRRRRPAGERRTTR